MPKQNRLISYAPDERGGGGEDPQDDKERKGDRGPRMIRVGDEDVAEEEVVRGYKGTRETTKRFEEVSKAEKRLAELERRATEREALADRRLAEAEERERKINTARDDILLHKQDGDKPERPSLRQRIATVDLIGDDKATEKLGDLFEEELSAREQTVGAKYQNTVDQLRTEMNAKIEAARKEAGTLASKPVAEERIRRQNDDTFNRVLSEEFEGVALNAEERRAVERKFRQKIGPDYGTWDGSAGVWVASDEAARDAVWSTPAVREKLLKSREAQARGDGLTARERGERATESTPGRPARPVSSDPDQALLQTAQELRRGVAEGRMSWEQAQDQFVKKAGRKGLKRYRELVQQERARDASEAA